MGLGSRLTLYTCMQVHETGGIMAHTFIKQMEMSWKMWLSFVLLKTV